MALNTQRLDRFISEHIQINRKNVRLLLAQNRVYVDGYLAKETAQLVNQFSVIVLDGVVVQQQCAYYIMLNKPSGVVCATKDKQHKTVIDLLTDKYEKKIIDQLHIVGRLDLNTSGMVLLTNDSQWSKWLTSPLSKVPKCYEVLLEKPVTHEYIDAFAQGMFFSYEDITTQPAELRILSSHRAEVILTEGRYHQIKRMFGRFRNKVIALHRRSIGGLQLDGQLPLGQSRRLTEGELKIVKPKISD